MAGPLDVTFPPDGDPGGDAADATANAAIGATTDTAVVTDANGTISGKLRGIVKILADVWDSTTHFLKTKEQYAPVAEDNTNGVMAMVEKPVINNTYSGTAFKAFGDDVDIAAKTAPGILLSTYASNENAAVRYLQIFDKASAPTSGNVPVFSFPIPAGTANNPGSVFVDTRWLKNYYFTLGVAIGISTVKGTFTAATTTEHTVNGQVF